MKMAVGITLAAAMALASSATHARGAASSSFVPRGPEPHSTLADKHGNQGSSHKGARRGKASRHKSTSHSSTPN